jgi:histone-lysine N-methyltransferase SETD1
MKVLDRITTELKQIMRKDLQRKMIENSAFRSFESWWDTEDNKLKVFSISLKLMKFVK